MTNFSEAALAVASMFNVSVRANHTVRGAGEGLKYRHGRRAGGRGKTAGPGGSGGLGSGVWGEWAEPEGVLRGAGLGGGDVGCVSQASAAGFCRGAVVSGGVATGAGDERGHGGILGDGGGTGKRAAD